MSYDWQLEKYIKMSLKNKPNHFLGVFASDELPKNVPYNSSLIANYSKHNEQGTHWVAISGLNTKKVNFFDSYGFDPDNENIILHTQSHFMNYINQHLAKGGKMHINEFEFQSINTDVCGEYAVKFILDGMPMVNNIINQKWKKYIDSVDSRENDKMILKEIKLRSLKH